MSTWTAGADVTTGDLITAAQWNNYLGLLGSLNYLREVTQAQPVRAKETIYRNTEGKHRLVSILLGAPADADWSGTLNVGVASPPATAVAGLQGKTAAEYGTITAIILPNYYYELEETVAAITVVQWTEWDLL